MTDIVNGWWYSLKDKWAAATLWQKIILANILYPWGPTIGLLLYYFAPPEVVEALSTSGQQVKMITGTGLELGVYFLGQWVSSLF